MTENKPQLELERTQKLQLFALLSVKKTVPMETIKDSMALFLVGAYSEVDAQAGAIKGLKLHGKNPDEYIPFMKLSSEVQQVLGDNLFKQQEPKKEVKSIIEENRDSSVADMTAHAKYIFAKSGTEEQQKVADFVINKFEKKNGQTDKL